MLAVIIGGVQERVHPHAAFEAVSVGAVGEKFLDFPAYAFDVYFGVVAHLPLSTECGVGRRCDYAAVFNGCDWVRARFVMACEKFVEGLPSSVGLDVHVHVVGRGVVVGLYGFRGERFGLVHPFAEFLDVFSHP